MGEHVTAAPERDLETRVANIERELANITEKLERLTQTRAENPFSGFRRPPISPKPPAAKSPSPSAEKVCPAAPEFPSPEWFAARGAEWWI